MDRRCIGLIVVGLVFTGWRAQLAGGQEYRYALIQLSVLNPDEPYTWTRAINNSGELAGASSTSSIGFHAVLWNSSSILDLGTLAGEQSEAKDFNNQEEVVGWSNFIPGNTSEQHAFLWRNGQMIDLGTLGGEESEANAINDLTQVVGFSDWPGGGGGFLWENGEMFMLPTLGRDGGEARDINNAGQIVGWSVTEDSHHKAVLWENGGVTALPTLRSDPSAAIAINDLGQIVGQSDGPNDHAHAVAWIDGQIFDLHNPDLGVSSSAWGMNNLGQVVGWVGRQPLNVSAFLWEQVAGMRTLDSLMPPNLRRNWRIDMAWDVNEAGQIAAQGYITGSPLIAYAFVITSVHPTMELGSPVPGIAGRNNTITATGCTPGATVTFYYSRFGGGTRIPGCDLQDAALQIDDPRLAGTAIADPTGTATLTAFVPNAARNLPAILLQAVEVSNCKQSQLIVTRFQ